MKVGAIYRVALSRRGEVTFLTKDKFETKSSYYLVGTTFHDEQLLFLGKRTELYSCCPKVEKFVFLYNNEIWFSDPLLYNFEEVIEDE